MTIARARHFVLTGAPGAGKTTLVKALRARGVACVDESARLVIRTQSLIRGRDLRTSDPALVTELTLQQDVTNFLAADPAVPTVFDRGIPDAVAGPEETSPAHHRRALEQFRYAPQVFVAPAWADIYETDAERTQTFAEALESHDRVSEAYRKAGYELVPLPLADPDARADFVLGRIGAALA